MVGTEILSRKMIGRRTGAAATPVQDDVIDTDLQCRIDILFDVLGRELVTDGDAAGAVAHFVGKVLDLAHLGPVREAGG